VLTKATFGTAIGGSSWCATVATMFMELFFSLKTMESWWRQVLWSLRLEGGLVEPDHPNRS